MRNALTLLDHQEMVSTPDRHDLTSRSGAPRPVDLFIGRRFGQLNEAAWNKMALDAMLV